MQVFTYYYRIVVHGVVAMADKPKDRIIAGVYSVDAPIADTPSVQHMLQQLGEQIGADPQRMDMTMLTFLGAFEMGPANEERMDA